MAFPEGLERRAEKKQKTTETNTWGLRIHPESLFMEEILHQEGTSWYGKWTIIYKVLYIERWLAGFSSINSISIFKPIGVPTIHRLNPPESHGGSPRRGRWRDPTCPLRRLQRGPCHTCWGPGRLSGFAHIRKRLQNACGPKFVFG